MAKIVYFDDEPELIRAQIERLGLTGFSVFDSLNEQERKVGFVQSNSADLLVLDFFWGNQDDPDAARTDENGLSALQKWRRLLKDARPATALVSSDIEKAISSKNPQKRWHIDAEKLGVEWVGKKDEIERIVALATASENIRRTIKSSRKPAISGSQRRATAPALSTLCFSVLKAPRNARWKLSAERQVDHARPPQPPTEGNDGYSREILAWLLHKVLPYPSFLMSNQQSAVRLGITLASFEKLTSIRNRSKLGEQIKQTLYTGPLDEFAGKKWWRAGIDHLVWSQSQSDDGYEKSISKLGGRSLELFRLIDPVVLSDADLVETNEIAESSNCVRVQDEDFPVGVAWVWVRKSSVANNQVLRNKVIFEDQVTLDEPRK